METWVWFLLLCSLLQAAASERVISSFTGSVGAGNYSYYTLHQKGTISLILETFLGDVDIYLSKTNERPTYADYDLESTTCGIDIITVPTDFPRPLHVALFGYSTAVTSKYKLTAIEDFEGVYEESSPEQVASAGDSNGEEPESFKSLLWTIIVGILKIILEVVF